MTLGVSQQGLADLIDCSVYSVSAWEQERNTPSGPTMALIARLVDDKEAEAADRSVEKAAA